MTEFVDVIITTYNRPDFLKQSLYSVINQTYNKIRIYIIDSSDNYFTNRIVSEFKQKFNADETGKFVYKKNIRFLNYIYINDNRISVLRNTGIKLSNSDYISFLDDDDLWLTKKIQKQIDILNSTDYKVCYTNEKWLRNNEHLNQKKIHQKHTGNIFKKSLKLCIISASSIMLKREVINHIGLFDPEFIVCEDYELWLRLSLYYEVYLLKQKLIIKQGGHSDQLSKKYPAMDRFRINVLLKLIKTQKLNSQQYKLVVEELINKCKIYINGCKKRNKFNESKRYFKIIEQYKN